MNEMQQLAHLTFCASVSKMSATIYGSPFKMPLAIYGSLATIRNAPAVHTFNKHFINRY